MVGEFLASGRQAADDGAAGELQVRATQVSLSGNKEQLLLQADHALQALDLIAQQLQKSCSFS